MKYIILLSACLYFSVITRAQSFAINTDGSTASSSAILDIKSTAKGLLIPRMNKAERNAITAPATGLTVYQLAPDSTGFYYFNGTVWKWLSNPDSETAWHINGNSGTDPFTNYIGTSDNNDLSFGINGFMRMKLSGEAALGIGEMFPKYPLDISTGQAAINNCAQTGIRVKNIGTFSNDCSLGFLFGYTNPLINSNDAVLWNYGNDPSNNSKNIIFGLGDFERMRLNNNGFLGLGQISPNYSLDVSIGAAAVNPCTRNGLRLNFPTLGNDCDKGLFWGFDDPGTVRSSSIWNFGDVTNPATDLFLRIGFGNQFTDPAQGGEVMRILPPGKGIGIGTKNPLAMMHITNYTGGGALPGVMITNPLLLPGAQGFYVGLRHSAAPNNGYVWNYQNAPVVFGTNDIERMTIKETGNVGIGTSTPGYRLDLANGSFAFGNSNTRSETRDNAGLQGNAGAQSGFFETSSPVNYPAGATSWWHLIDTRHSNGANNYAMQIAGSFFDQELWFRKTNGGASQAWTRLLTTTNFNFTGWSLFGNSGTNATNNFIGTADAVDLVIRTNNVEAVRVNTIGNVGIGTNNPAKKTEIIGPASAIPVTLVIGNRGGFGPAAIEFVSDYGMANQWRPGYIRSNDLGVYTGSLEFYTNGTGVGNLYGNVKGLEVRNGVTYTATGTVTTWSDARLKKDIHPFTSGLEIINQINPVSFYYNQLSPFQTDKMQIGILAQELEKIAPYMVDKNGVKDFNDLRSVNNQAYIFLLINAVKELQKEVEALKKQKR